MKQKKQKQSMENHNWFLFVITCLIMIILACWCVDISVSAMLTGGTLTNGWSTRNPMLMYHMAMYTIVIFIAVLSFITSYLIYKKIQFDTLTPNLPPINFQSKLQTLLEDNILNERDEQTILDILSTMPVSQCPNQEKM